MSPKTTKTKKNLKKRLVLLDAHAIIHRAYHALPDFASSKGEPTGALYGLSTMLIKIINEFKPDYITACYDLPKPTYRHEVYEDYKAGRAKADDELTAQLERSKDIFTAFNIPIYAKEGFEADDILGTIVEQLKKDKGVDVMIASGDMDTLQLVEGKKVQVYTLKKGIKDTITYDEEAVKERFGFGPKLLPDYKGLRGDPSDNIIGIVGVGEKTATTLIQNFGSIEDIYKKLKKDEKAFEKVGIKPRIIGLLQDNKEEALFSKMLATIRRDAPIKFKLPTDQWREVTEPEPINKLFADLEFRTLGARIKDILKPETKSLLDSDSTDQASGEQASFNDAANQNIDPKEVEEIGVALWLIDSTITKPTLDDILNFARTKSFTKARETILAEIEKRDLKKVFVEIERPLMPVIRQMEDFGVKVDRAYLAKLSKKYHQELSKLEKRIWRQVGEEFNINSPKQLGEMLFDKLGLKIKNHKKTAGGSRSTRESELEKMRDEHAVVADILEYRELQKLLSTYIDNLPNLVDKSSRLHAQFVQTGSATGRMSSQDPNLQNIPIKSERGKAIRNAFIAETGFKLLAIDYSQIELRIAAVLSGDKKLIDIFKNERDVHREVAAQVFEVPPEKVDSEMRRQAKVINFGILYGMGVNALRQNLGTSRDEAQKFYNDYFKTFSGLARYLAQVKADAARNGFTKTFFGRRRYFAGINSKLPFIRAAAERMAINAPIQGTNADIIKIAMVQISDFLKRHKLTDQVHMTMQVHDELVFEIATDQVSKVTTEVKKIMEGVVDPKKTHGIIFRADASVGDNWGEMEEVKS